MALDGATQARYREAGPAIMASLLPELRREAGRAIEAAKGFEDAKTNFESSDIELAETMNTLIASLNRKIPDDDHQAREELRGFRDLLAATRMGVQGSESAQEGAHAHWEYVAALRDRERWIMDELQCLGLLPSFGT